jgi:hypothetical protein
MTLSVWARVIKLAAKKRSANVRKFVNDRERMGANLLRGILLLLESEARLLGDSRWILMPCKMQILATELALLTAMRRRRFNKGLMPSATAMRST